MSQWYCPSSTDRVSGRHICFWPIPQWRIAICGDAKWIAIGTLHRTLAFVTGVTESPPATLRTYSP
jgi:hypothetical protein